MPHELTLCGCFNGFRWAYLQENGENLNVGLQGGCWRFGRHLGQVYKTCSQAIWISLYWYSSLNFAEGDSLGASRRRAHFESCVSSSAAIHNLPWLAWGRQMSFWRSLIGRQPSQRNYPDRNWGVAEPLLATPRRALIYFPRQYWVNQ